MTRGALFPALALLLIAAAPPRQPATPRPAATTPPEAESEHVVQPGETLGGIAQRAGVARVLIIKANGLKPPYGLRAGQKLAIPRTRQHIVARGDTPFTIAYLYAVEWRDIATANGLPADAPLKPGQKLLIPTIVTSAPAPAAPASSAAAPKANTPAAPAFAWPIASGTVKRGFAPRGRSGSHDGLDLDVPEGTTVRATAAGRVIFAGEEPRQFGRLVVIEHEGGWQSAYAFLSRPTVKAGDTVRQGERVGLSGRTGQARGAELHFELRRDNQPVDPAAQLPRRN